MNNIQQDNQKGIIRSLDWWTIAIYIALLAFGWLSVCGASYTYGETDIFSLDTRSGMQIVWIGTSICLGFVILMLDDRFFDTPAYFIYFLLMLLLFATIFNPHSIKGSRSWLVLGPLRLQPAEFAKFATALAVSKFMSSYSFNIERMKDFCMAAGIVFLPMLLIVLQRETGSALVYLAFFLMFYREGMSGNVLFTGIAMVVYFVVGVRFGETMLYPTPTPIGEFAVLLLIQIVAAAMVWVYCDDKPKFRQIIIVAGIIDAAAILFAFFVIPFNVSWVLFAVCIVIICHLLYLAFHRHIVNYLFIALFAIASMAYFFSANYVLNNVLEPHQRVRVNVLLGLETDISGAGYNVHQSEIAIGSGGLQGKGFLNGTQTKLKFVPEQDTDFIFCTVGEEEGFLGSAGVLLLFLALIIRLIIMAERQPMGFGRIYGYCVLSIFLFHVFINVGMVLGLTPVIGIPLPFFSYGGSSLWGFTILMFIFLRIDAGRNLVRR